MNAGKVSKMAPPGPAAHPASVFLDKISFLSLPYVKKTRQPAKKRNRFRSREAPENGNCVKKRFRSTTALHLRDSPRDLIPVARPLSVQANETAPRRRPLSPLLLPAFPEWLLLTHRTSTMTYNKYKNIIHQTVEMSI